MKTVKLVLLISLMLLIIPFNIKTSAQQPTQNKPKENVVAYEVAGMNDVIVKKDIPYLKDPRFSTKNGCLLSTEI